MKMSAMWCVIGGFALATSAYAGGGSGQAELKMMDADQDGSVSASEHAAGAKKMFEKMDADGDGIVTAKEMGAAHKDMPTARSQESLPAPNRASVRATSPLGGVTRP